MGWDSSRPVEWRRLVREWLLYAGIMLVIFGLFFRDNGLTGAAIGLLVSGPLYLAIGFALAKLGYRRPSVRAAGTGAAATAATVEEATPPRERPAPTRRTSVGPSNRPGKRR